MELRNKQHRWLLHLLGAAILLLGLTACDSSEGSTDDDPDKPKPETPVADGDWQVVPATGGTIEKGDISITFPSGTFSKDSKVAVTEVKASDIAREDARSIFYQVTLPTSGTQKPFSVKLKCAGSTDNVLPIIKTPGWDIHSGQDCNITLGLESTVSNGEVVASIPMAENGGTENPYFIIGLIEGVPDNDMASTRSSMDKYNYRTAINSIEAFKDREKYAFIRKTVLENIEISHNILEIRGFKIFSPVSYELKDPDDVKKLSECWGLFQPASFFKSLGCVYLNRDKFMTYATNKTDSLLNELKATLIHETLHSVYYKDYDPRLALTIIYEGVSGDDWAQFDEAMGCWVEKFVGKKVVGGDNTVDHQRQFISAFYPSIRNATSCRNTGYGMATFLEFLSQKAGNNSLVEIFEYQKNGTSSFRDALNLFLKKHNISFFNSKDYYDFAFSVIDNKFDSRINYDILFSKATSVTKEYHFKSDVFNYGVSMQRAQFSPSILKQYADSAIIITQNNNGVHTRLYYIKGRDLIQIGQCEKGDTVWISVKELCNYYGYDVNDLNSKKSLQIFLTTTRINNLEDYSSLPSDITINISSKQQKSASISPTTLTFPSEGGTQTLTVTAKGYNKYNHTISFENKSDEANPWLLGNNTSGGKLEVTALPNTTGKKRVGYVHAYVFDKDKPNDKVYLDSVKVTQAANEKQDDDTQSGYQIVNGSVSMYYAIEWKWEVSFKSTDNNVTITPKGKGANVVIQQAGKDFNAEWNSEISFDIDDLSLFESGKAKLSNYRFEMVRDGWDANFGWSHSDWSKTTTKLTSNAPKAQEASLLWYFKPEDLSYDYNQTIHYDKWKKDAYTEPIEKTEVNPKTEVTSGSFVSVGLDVKKKK